MQLCASCASCSRPIRPSHGGSRAISLPVASRRSSEPPRRCSPSSDVRRLRETSSAVSAGAEGSPSGTIDASALPARLRERRLGSSERFSSSLMAPPPTEPRKSSDLIVARLSVPPRRTSESLVMYATRAKSGSAQTGASSSETGASSSMAVSVILARFPPAVKCAAFTAAPTHIDPIRPRAQNIVVALRV